MTLWVITDSGGKMDKDKVEAFLAAIDQNNYDTEAWQAVLRLVHNDNIERHRETVYEKLVTVFPSSGKFWKNYIEHEVQKGLRM